MTGLCGWTLRDLCGVSSTHVDSGGLRTQNLVDVSDLGKNPVSSADRYKLVKITDPNTVCVRVRKSQVGLPSREGGSRRTCSGDVGGEVLSLEEE